MAATAIQAGSRWALRAQHSTSLAVSLAVCARACRSADGGVDPLPATMQMINFEIALRSRDPNAKDCLRKVRMARSA